MRSCRDAARRSRRSVGRSAWTRDPASPLTTSADSQSGDLRSLQAPRERARAQRAAIPVCGLRGARSIASALPAARTLHSRRIGNVSGCPSSSTRSREGESAVYVDAMRAPSCRGGHAVGSAAPEPPKPDHALALRQEYLETWLAQCRDDHDDGVIPHGRTVTAGCDGGAGRCSVSVRLAGIVEPRSAGYRKRLWRGGEASHYRPRRVGEVDAQIRDRLQQTVNLDRLAFAH